MKKIVQCDTFPSPEPFFGGQMVTVEGLRNDTRYNGAAGVVADSNPGQVSR